MVEGPVKAFSAEGGPRKKVSVSRKNSPLKTSKRMMNKLMMKSDLETMSINDMSYT